MKPHKHKDLIIAWANGAEIQFRFATEGSEWKDVTNPEWVGYIEYRIKPDLPNEKYIKSIENLCKEISTIYQEFDTKVQKKWEEIYQQNKQIKPFSEEKLKQLWYETKNIMGWYSFQEIAKLIEKSHGIE